MSAPVPVRNVKFRTVAALLYYLQHCTDVLTSKFVKTLVDKLVFFRWSRPRLNVIKDESTGHDGASIQHRIVRLVCRFGDEFS